MIYKIKHLIVTTFTSGSTTEHIHTTIKGINFFDLWLFLLLGSRSSGSTTGSSRG
jgi:hypothetical protein